MNGRDRIRDLGVQRRWQDNIEEHLNKREFEGVN